MWPYTDEEVEFVSVRPNQKNDQTKPQGMQMHPFYHFEDEEEIKCQNGLQNCFKRDITPMISLTLLEPNMLTMLDT